MTNVTADQVLQAIVDEVYERVNGGDLSMDDLNCAAVTLLNVKERERMEPQEMVIRRLSKPDEQGI